MPSLRQISAQFPSLLIDAASTEVQVAVLQADGATQWETSTEESGVAVFQCIEALNVDPSAMNAFIFCEGPGSILGIRTVAMALRTWGVLKPRPFYAYSSLAIVAYALGRPQVGIIADARRDTWHHFQIGRGFRRVQSSDLSGELVMPENFRHWSTLPPNVSRVPYALRDLLPQIRDADVFHLTDSPDAFLHEEPSYVTWTPQIHQAPE